MPHAIGGFLYEEKIFNIMNSIGLIPKDFKSTAGSSAIDPDIVVDIGGKKVNIEIKQNIKAQSGGTSIKYSKGKKLMLVKELSCLTNEDVNDKLNNHIKNLDRLLDFFEKEKISFTSTKAKWTNAVKKGIIKSATTRIESSTDFIEDHYASKNVNYIHFGNHGLFYMKKDIMNLGVPRLNGNVVLEVRPARNGSSLNRHGIRVCIGSLRVQARIKNVQKSHVSLEDGDKFLDLVNKLK
jgi:hypothetical protein